ncbi:odorant receptor 49b-like [Leptidea sinapis]|uniref:odorant receptor 49b-like n=1 Tax=Leptidea sinapis TaxID=189913 RepID=UPI0021C2D7AC|nr:odorant receptor 49b-like [Leptidea sinapis]
MQTFNKITNMIEISKYPCLGPNLSLLKFVGLWHPILDRTAKIKLVLFFFIISFFFSQYLKCVISFNIVSVKLILQYAPFHLGIIKACFFLKDYKHWISLIEYISIIETAQLSDKRVAKVMKSYIKYSRMVTYSFWTLAFFSNFSIFSEPYRSNHDTENSSYVQIFDGYNPFSRVPSGYYFGIAIQTILGHVVSAYVVGWDTCIVSIMIFFAGQLQISRVYCKRIGCLENDSANSNYIATFHHYYTNLIQYHNLFNSLTSPVMFVYLIVISVSLGVCIIQIVENQNDVSAVVSGCLYVNACLIQLLLFYWHSNEVTETCLLVSYGIFESNWVHTNCNLRRDIFLLGELTSKKLVFNAGPFNNMSLKTFVSILRASYSFFTLLDKK